MELTEDIETLISLVDTLDYLYHKSLDEEREAASRAERYQARIQAVQSKIKQLKENT